MNWEQKLGQMEIHTAHREVEERLLDLHQRIQALGGAMICQFHGGHAVLPAGVEPCPYCQQLDMRAVFDAAMALTEADTELILDVLANCEELAALERFEALRDAMRRAKEGR